MLCNYMAATEHYNLQNGTRSPANQMVTWNPMAPNWDRQTRKPNGKLKSGNTELGYIHIQETKWEFETLWPQSGTQNSWPQIWTHRPGNQKMANWNLMTLNRETKLMTANLDTQAWKPKNCSKSGHTGQETTWQPETLWSRSGTRARKANCKLNTYDPKRDTLASTPGHTVHQPNGKQMPKTHIWDACLGNQMATWDPMTLNEDTPAWRPNGKLKPSNPQIWKHSSGHQMAKWNHLIPNLDSHLRKIYQQPENP